MDRPQSKPHFEVLDGLRGTAALLVVLFHHCEAMFSDPSTNPLGPTFLAVDFFFCLSGFVVGYAYDQRRELGMTGFLKTRMIRLHPMVLVGVTLGLLGFVFDPFFSGSPWEKGAAAVWLSYATSLLLIPYAAYLPDHFDLVFPLDAPAWSLFWEYLANVVYALLLWRLPRRALVVLVAAAAVALLAMGWRQGAIDGGWSLGNLWMGGPRTAFAFFSGLLVWRYRLVLRTPFGYGALSLLLIVIFMTARTWWLQAAVIVAVFPLIVALGAGAQVSGWPARVCSFLGRISYPLYITHNFVIWPYGHFYQRFHPQPWQAALIVCGSVVTVVALAYAFLRWFDEPVRAWLTRRWMSTSARGATAAVAS